MTNWARSGEAPHQLQEAVDVGVVERGLDLVEDVERARPGEEHREHEGERDQRLLAAREQREALHCLAARGHFNLDPKVVAAIVLVVSVVLLGGLRRIAEVEPAQAPRPPGKRCSTSSSKFFAVASNVSSNAS